MTSRVTKAINNKHVPAESITLLCSLEAKTVSVTRSYCFPFFLLVFLHLQFIELSGPPQIIQGWQKQKNIPNWLRMRGGEITEWDEVKRFYKKTALRGEFRSKEKKEEWQKSMHLYWVKWEKRKSDLEDFSEHCPPDGKMQLSGKQWHYLHMYSPWKRTRERFYNSAFCCPLEAPLTSLRYSRAVTHTEKFISALGQKGRWVMNMRKWKLRFSWKPTESCIKENNEKNESF